MIGNGQPEFAQGISVDRYFFPLLGVAPALGRGFTVEDEKDGSPNTMILSYAFWQQRFAGDQTILGQDILLDKRPYTVVGIMPQFAAEGFGYAGMAQRETKAVKDDHNPEAVQKMLDYFVLAAERSAPADAWRNLRGAPCILEGFVDFACEVSVVAGRAADGTFAAYDLCANTHRLLTALPG